MTAISAYSANRMPSFAAAPAAPQPTLELQRSDSPASRSQTGFDPTPVSVAPTSGQAAVTAAVGAQFGAPMARDFSSAAGGGAITDALKSGVAKIAAWAQRGMTGIQEAIQGDMNANNGQVDPAKMQQYTMQMTNYELMMQMAAKIQEKEEAAIKIWLR